MLIMNQTFSIITKSKFFYNNHLMSTHQSTNDQATWSSWMWKLYSSQCSNKNNRTNIDGYKIASLRTFDVNLKAKDH